MMKYFVGVDISDMQGLRSAYRDVCLKMHPDKGGEHEAFVAMQAEYEELIARATAGETCRAKRDNRPPRYTTAGETELMRMIEQLMRMPGLIIEICGTWLWVSGNTYANKDSLKEHGFRFSTKKKRWYWSPYGVGARHRGRYSMDEIRRRYGSETIETEGQRELESAAA